MAKYSIYSILNIFSNIMYVADKTVLDHGMDTTMNLFGLHCGCIKQQEIQVIWQKLRNTIMTLICNTSMKYFLGMTKLLELKSYLLKLQEILKIWIQLKNFVKHTWIRSGHQKEDLILCNGDQIVTQVMPHLYAYRYVMYAFVLTWTTNGPRSNRY